MTQKLWLPKTVRDILKPKPVYQPIFSPNYLKKCVKCGKEVRMYKNQKQCHECYTKERTNRNKAFCCFICGRSGHNLYPYGKNRICSFCKNNMARERQAEKEGYHKSRKYCESCRRRITQPTFEKYQGLCKDCFEFRELEKQVLLKGMI